MHRKPVLRRQKRSLLNWRIPPSRSQTDARCTHPQPPPVPCTPAGVPVALCLVFLLIADLSASCAVMLAPGQPAPPAPARPHGALVAVPGGAATRGPQRPRGPVSAAQLRPGRPAGAVGGTLECLGATLHAAPMDLRLPGPCLSQYAPGPGL